ncbi:MAG: hypothetical protein J6J33_04740 [Clostridia bacterium]|nr:hypothetical protein [Clostridia bacterium]
MEKVVNESVWGIRDYDAENHWRKLNLKKHKINVPTIIALGGSGTITERAANGMLEIIEGMLRSVLGDVDICKEMDLIGVAYGVHTIDEASAQQKQTGDLLQREIEDFANNILLPLCYDEKGNLLSIDEICKNFSLITFVTHCAGAQILDELLEYVLFKVGIQNDQINEELIEKLSSSIKHVSYAPINGIGQRVPTTYFYSAKDRTFAGNILFNDISFEFNVLPSSIEEISLFLKSKRSYYGKIPSLGVVSGQLQNDGKGRKMIDEHSFSVLRKLMTGETMPFNGRVSANRDCFSKIMSIVIAKCVQNSFINYVQDKPESFTLEEVREEINEFIEGFYGYRFNEIKNLEKIYKKYEINSKLGLAKDKQF